MKNLIQFRPLFQIPYYIKPFKPASTNLPDWYKSMPNHIFGDTKNGLSKFNPEAPNVTMKGCAPFLDALTTGYIFELFCDVEIRRNETGNLIRWRIPEEVVTMHDKDQFPGFPKSNESEWNDVFKWHNYFNIKTPKGYSCLFTHPFNRLDLPFRTLTGVVDTDSYPNAVQFPFQVNELNEDFIVIKKGTPLCQIIPFKRTDWTSEYLPFDAKIADKSRFDLFSTIVRSYKTQWWNKKTYQ